MDKLGYTIAEVSQRYQINSNTLRYYERIGLLPDVPRASNGHRYFTKEILAWLEMIICLRHSGVSIETLTEYASLLKEGNSTVKERENLLREQLTTLYQKQANLQRSIDRLEKKIALYESGEIEQDLSYFEDYAILSDEKDSWKEIDV
ncbi:TPA: MerR family transcriptional regulator [Streptococcus suis]|uniref:MerR family transcriptional regulator n=1 Tax=Streptococcus suis TaxID=1307 RepID=A0A116LC96_STRSU|nr:MerR family transcriptional regulator [Streptococcus suis]MBY4961108.1 MerR family transcriptional regulator [Streptococcus suis]MBY4967431.1 MerR family transcriptional regulator [Streptococcus suis]MBY4975668.1 MerR family transcriptional regulator [Streptococcus suis]MBY4978505.1 MerR family transcriptional regulator [Streptococcus suis]MBY4987014.1 MerR family transcriptional regulator [Streptococcus suis]